MQTSTLARSPTLISQSGSASSDELLLLSELQHRRECRRSLNAWCTHALAPLGQVPAAHHRLLIAELQRVADGLCDRLMIFMPPGSGKSRYTSQLFPAWLLSRGIQLIGASHTDDLAEDFSAKVQAYVAENAATLGFGLRGTAVGRWYTTNRGAYLAAGVRSAIPGFRADGVVIDDPVKGRAAADSVADRKKVWDWYNGDLERRLTPRSFIVLMHTRWHESDLAGMLLATEPHRWRVLNLPAEAEDNDQLGRLPGEWLWSDDAYGYGASLPGIKKSLEDRGATREWASQYQQRPRPPEGALFKTLKIEILDAVPAGGSAVRAWDLASTSQVGTNDPDFTAGVKLRRLPEGRFVIEDVVRFRGGPDEVEAAIVNTAKRDGKSVRIGLPLDPGQAGKQQVLYLTRKLSGFTVESSPESGDKATRAAPVASQCNVGNLAVVKAQWNAALLDELAFFPAGSKDDQVDALSRAFAMVSSPVIIGTGFVGVASRDQPGWSQPG
jgi:predicted phage terminase large subunit-like protein